MIDVVIVLVITVLCTYVSGEFAVSRGRAVKTWYWMGALFGPFAVIAVFLLPPLHKKAAV